MWICLALGPNLSHYTDFVLCHDEERNPLFTSPDIEEFRTIWREEFGEDLQQEKAVVVADRFLRAIHLIVKLADRADAKAVTIAAVDEPEEEMAK